MTCGRSSDLRDCRDGPMRIGQAIRVIPLVWQSARMYICSFLEFHWASIKESTLFLSSLIIKKNITYVNNKLQLDLNVVVKFFSLKKTRLIYASHLVWKSQNSNIPVRMPPADCTECYIIWGQEKSFSNNPTNIENALIGITGKSGLIPCRLTGGFPIGLEYISARLWPLVWYRSNYKMACIGGLYLVLTIAMTVPI